VKEEALKRELLEELDIITDIKSLFHSLPINTQILN
jgi:hypothetical protein